MIVTDRLILHPWQERHRSAFILMHADGEVMADQGGPLAAPEGSAKFDRYRAALDEHGTSRWAVETPAGLFIGYAGVMPRPDEYHPLGPHFEIGWRFRREAWGKGHATEAARAALDHARSVVRITDIVSYTGADNLRSQAVMARLGFRREASRDFMQRLPDGTSWHGLVWEVPTH
ncbi:GNAT family N-acetyltransferase [Mesorhizobium sp. CAU 1741]|uniref:GNAT family N-acetyltransferase n=1 Tax=Mesorhizobium sp. CAU 1741 TaxID=3140366 RepID=UPI00325B8845